MGKPLGLRPPSRRQRPYAHHISARPVQRSEFDGRAAGLHLLSHGRQPASRGAFYFLGPWQLRGEAAAAAGRCALAQLRCLTSRRDGRDSSAEVKGGEL